MTFCQCAVNEGSAYDLDLAGVLSGSMIVASSLLPRCIHRGLFLNCRIFHLIRMNFPTLTHELPGTVKEVESEQSSGHELASLHVLSEVDNLVAGRCIGC